MSAGHEKLVGWRKSRNITQEAAAQLFRVGQSTLCEYEKGHKLPGVQVALRIAEATAGEVPVEAWSEVASAGDAA